MNNKTFLNSPELHIGIAAFFLHFVWELIQTPLYSPSDPVSGSSMRTKKASGYFWA